MTAYVKAGAYSNIALVKYWGKRNIEKNIPAVPSISLSVDKLFTETEITPLDSDRDEFYFDDEKISDQRADRVFRYLDLWREEKLIEGRFSVRTRNSFPTASGMASSASGFAALAMGLGEFSSSALDLKQISRLARRGSGSAARSVTGGISAFPCDNDDPYAETIKSPEDISFGMVAVLVETQPKKTGSRSGMIHSAESSPYFQSWIDQGHKDYRAMLEAIERNDFTKTGQIAEQNCLAMHACMLASRPQLLYWTDRTLRVIESVQELRDNGLEVYFTIDAGPQIFLLSKLEDLEEVEKGIAKLEGIEETVILHPSGGAWIE